ncbi:MAG: hypothetical protein ATN31_06900 [Candidatus Epulonipiscioides saccharophilum]|nr:MAG: hypothetical protein ATN31_06900 [Epulopiscium sp. AS2M-Bin001]
MPTENNSSEDINSLENTSEKVAYFTFDDGPTSGITSQLLDELNRLNIKATFFVVGKEIIDKEYILKRIYSEGHSIGLHTYSHDYKKIYSSPETFLTEMQKTSDYINEILGIDANIKFIRFPGGSAGKLNQAFYDQIKACGYTIFDWNVNLEDGVRPDASVEELVNNAKKVSNKMTERIILAHCNLTNDNTIKAIEPIYEYYKSLGYRFDVINNETKEYYYKFNK